MPVNTIKLATRIGNKNKQTITNKLNFGRIVISPGIGLLPAGSVLEVSLDYLVGSYDSILEKALVKKITDIQKLAEEDKICVHKMLDAFLRDSKAKQAYGI